MSKEQQDMIIEAVQQAIDGLITDREMIWSIERITASKIEDHAGVFGTTDGR